MKTLLILRHAKSSQTDELADHDRPLNARGQRDAPRVGRLLRAQDLEPDRVLCSTAKRARTTATEVIEGSGYDPPVELLEELYLASPSTHIDVLRRQIGEPDCLMIVAHNPGLEELLAMLVGQYLALPTAALAQVELPLDQWSQLSTDVRGELANLWLPRELD